MILNYLADQFIFNNLKKISYGYLQIIDSKGKEYFFARRAAVVGKICINPIAPALLTAL